MAAILLDPSNRLRTVAILSSALWLLSLALPASWGVFEYAPGLSLGGQAVEASPGWAYLLLGWGGPFLLLDGGLPAPTPDMVPPGALPMLPATDIGTCLGYFAWYANPLWMWTIARLLRKKRPHPLLALAVALLAFAGLQARHDHLSDSHGVDSAEVPAIGAYLWAAALCLPGATLLLARFSRSRRTADAWSW